MSVTQKTQNMVWGLCAARCCICKEPLISGKESKKFHIGEIAHIVGEKTSAARGNSHLTKEERNNESNLILLCANHHTLIDRNPDEYPIEKLLKIKNDHIQWINNNLPQCISCKSNISQFTYINIPRLTEQSYRQGASVDLSCYKENKSLHSLKWELNKVMSAFDLLLKRINFDAISSNKLKVFNDNLIGNIISFERVRFRTRNIHVSNLDNIIDNPTPFSGDLQKDPHIYTSIENFKFILNIDFRWITTTTAFCLFRPSGGSSLFSGLGTITNINYIKQIVTITPLVLGIPAPKAESIYTNHLFNVNQSLNMEKFIDMETAKKRNIYDSGPECCDLCHKIFKNEKYLIDCQIKNISTWAYMCEECFSSEGKGIGWGTGQLYMNTKDGWLLVGGFPPEEDY